MKPANITVVVSSPDTETFHKAVQEITSEYGKIINLHFYHLSTIDEELVDDTLFRKDLQNSDIILLDIRPQQRGAEIITEVLSLSNNTVIPLFATSRNIWQLARLGSFVMKKYAKQAVAYDLDSEACFEEVLKGQKIQKMIRKTAKILPVGSLKHGSNWSVAIDYWRYGGKENIKNLLLFVASYQ